MLASSVNQRSDQNQQSARNLAASLEFIAAIFNCPPDKTTAANMKSAGEPFWAELESDENSSIREGIQELAQFAEQCRQMDEREIEIALRADWTKLFRGLGAGFGPIPPFEALFLGRDGNDVDILQTVAQTYIKFNLVNSDVIKNRQDYLGIEIDFLRYLAEKEADAWQEMDEQKARVYQTAFNEFFSNHPYQWGRAFCDQAAKCSDTKFYRGFLYLVQGILQDIFEERIQ